MDKLNFVEIETLRGLETYAIIDRADGSQLSMLKETYDRQQAEQSTPSVTNGD